MWKWLEQYFTFTKSERNAIVALAFLSLLALVAPKVYFYFRPVEHADNSKYEKEIADFTHQYNGRNSTAEDKEDSLGMITGDTARYAAFRADTSGYHKRKWVKPQYFVFDPNTIGVAEWMKLGFSEKQAESIEKYKDHGGKFYRPEDLERLYVMSDEHYNQLLPYVKINVDALPERHKRKQ